MWGNSKEMWPLIPRTSKKSGKWEHLEDDEPEPPEGSPLQLCGVAQHVTPATSKGKKCYFCSNTEKIHGKQTAIFPLLTVIVGIFVVVKNTDCKS